MTGAYVVQKSYSYPETTCGDVPELIFFSIATYSARTDIFTHAVHTHGVIAMQVVLSI